MGNDYSVNLAAHSGQLQLNAYEPLAGLAVIESQALLFSTSNAFRTKCIEGITLNKKVLAHYLETTVGIVTALNPIESSGQFGNSYEYGGGFKWFFLPTERLWLTGEVFRCCRRSSPFDDRQFLTCDGRFRNIWDEHDCRVKQQWRKQLYA